MSNTLLITIVYLLGVIVGTIATNILYTRAGDFEIDDKSNPDHDIYRFKIDMPLEKLPKCRYLLLKVKHKKLSEEE